MTAAGGGIRVLIADEQPVVRLGLRHLLSGDPAFQVVGEVESLAQLERALINSRPDVVLVEPGPADGGGLELLRRICNRAPAFRVIVYTSHADQVRIVTALELGVAGYLLKEGQTDTLLHDIRRVHAGDAVLSPAVASALVEHIQKQATVQQQDVTQLLTNRELEVLGHLAHGMSNRAIATTLCVCEATVKFHVHAILEKLEASNRTEAVMTAIERGLVRI